jgi:hypothetical protein
LEIKIDDIFAALMLSLVMMRRIEVKSTEASQNPTVDAKQFDDWKVLALRAHNQVAVACLAKVMLSIGWYALGMRAGVGFPWFQLGGVAIFVSWAMALIWAWKIATDARHMRLSLGIRLRRRASTSRSSSRGSAP